MAVQIKADEITEIIRSQIQGFDRKLDVAETGIILSVGDGIARVYGLEGVMAGELLEFPQGVFGLALNLEQDNVGAVLFGGKAAVRARRGDSGPAGIHHRQASGPYHPGRFFAHRGGGHENREHHL